VTAPHWKFRIDRGGSVALAITIKDQAGNTADLTGYTAHLQVRDYPEAPSTLLDLSTANGGIVIASNRLLIVLSAAQTAALTWWHGVYDMFLTSPNGTRYRILQGEAEVSEAVTIG
jgi:hypothetical protein